MSFSKPLGTKSTAMGIEAQAVGSRAAGASKIPTHAGGIWGRSRPKGKDLPGSCTCIAGTPLYLGYFGGTTEDYGDQSPNKLSLVLLLVSRVENPGVWLPTVCARGFASSPRREEGSSGDGGEESLGKWTEAEALEPGRSVSLVFWMLRSPHCLDNTQGPPPGTGQHIHQQ